MRMHGIFAGVNASAHHDCRPPGVSRLRDVKREVRCSDNEIHLGMTESSSSPLSSRVLQHAMDAEHRKYKREHQGIPEAPQARSSAAGPLPSQPVGKLTTDRTFCRRGMRLLRLGNCATLHLSVPDAHAPCSPSILIVFFLFFPCEHTLHPLNFERDNCNFETRASVLW